MSLLPVTCTIVNGFKDNTKVYILHKNDVQITEHYFHDYFTHGEESTNCAGLIFSDNCSVDELSSTTRIHWKPMKKQLSFKLLRMGRVFCIFSSLV